MIFEVVLLTAVAGKGQGFELPTVHIYKQFELVQLPAGKALVGVGPRS